jgi:hypothetical protein
MSHVVDGFAYYPDDQAVLTDLTAVRTDNRSVLTALPFLLPVALCGISYMADGIAPLTDAGFALLTLLCIVFVIRDFLQFRRYLGIGGIVLFGGVLIWICQDYCVNWFGLNFSAAASKFRPVTVAEAAFYNCLLVLFMVLGISIRRSSWLEKLLTGVPEPSTTDMYWWTALALSIFGFLPFLFFTREAPWVSLFKAALGSWFGVPGVEWIGGRTGNVNASWYAYLAQVMQVGQIGALLLMMYVVFMTRSWIRYGIALAIWLFWVLFAMEGGRRGEVAFETLPVIAFYFFRYQSRTMELAKRFSWQAYVVCGLLILLFLFVVQAQGTFRARGSFGALDVSKIELFRNQGNDMFSEGLAGFALIPSEVTPYYDKLPGQAIIEPIPQKIFDLVTGMIPRTLWPSRPIDPVWAWYNKYVTGERGTGTMGTTISNGPAGHWYFRYGVFGIIEGGLLFGWLMGVSERALRRAIGRPTAMLICIAFGVWLFRAYRDFIFIDLYPLIIFMVVYSIACNMIRPFFSAAEA